jgi:hypothetical protein
VFLRSSKLRGIFIGLILIFSTSFSAGAFEELNWDSVANVDVNEIVQRARLFLVKEAPELSNVKIKLLEVSADYREEHKRLYVSFYHDQSYIEGSEEVMTVQTEAGEKEHSFITFDIVVVKFDGTGKPIEKEIFGQKFPGTKEDFKRQFEE